MTLFEQILEARGLAGGVRDDFLSPLYSHSYDPFLLPDMAQAVERLEPAKNRDESIMIYGDYDIDGLTATALLLDAFESFGFRHVNAFLPNRFVEGYGLTVSAVEQIAATGVTLIITVDCGSLSEQEIKRAAELGVDVIVTDHHNVAPVRPPAIAVINPKRLLVDYPEQYANYRLIGPKKLYPFLDLPGVGVAFKLVQALQTRLNGLPDGQEKWLLDLVGLGTVCDVVNLVDENRMHVYWGLRVLAKTRRPGLRALLAVSRVEPNRITARSLGFGLGPRMNAAGRLETAQCALDMLRARDNTVALDKAEQLDTMNLQRRADQKKILSDAKQQAERYRHHNVLVVSAPGWSHGIIGIVAANLLELYQKPTFVLEEMGDESKGSARSYGDFSVADAIRVSDDLITKGGGHKFAAGVTLPTANIDAFRQRVNEYFLSLNLRPQPLLLLSSADVAISDFSEINEQLIAELATLEPYGSGNPEVIVRIDKTVVSHVRRMGDERQHLKLGVRDSAGREIELLAFSAPAQWFVEPGERVTVWFTPTLNEWQGRSTVEGRLTRLELFE